MKALLILLSLITTNVWGQYKTQLMVQDYSISNNQKNNPLNFRDKKSFALRYGTPGYDNRKSSFMDNYCPENLLGEEYQQFEKFTKKITGLTCYVDKFGNTGSQKFALTLTDFQRCECLGFMEEEGKKENYFLNIHKFKVATQNSDDNYSSVIKRNFENNAKSLWSDIESRRNAISLSAAIYFDSNPDLTGYFTNNQKDVQSMLQDKQGALAKAVENVKHSIKERDGDPKTVEKFAKDIEKIQNDVFRFKEDTASLYRGEIPNPDYNCISPIEFLAYKQKPSLQVMNDINGTYSPDDWHFEKLKDQFNNLKISGNYEKKKIIQDRLEFLNRNPMIRLILQSEDALHKDKKVELMSILKDYAKECEKDCNNFRKLQNESDKEFRRALTDFFSRKDNRELLQKLSDTEWKSDLEKINAKNGRSNLGANPKITNRTDLLRDFKSLHGMNPEWCGGENRFFDIDNCNKTYAYYCQYLKDAKVSKFIPNEEIDDIEKILSEGRSLNFATNEEYNNMNVSLCGRPILKNGKFTSYNDYKKSCKGSNEECRKKFFEEYKEEILKSDDGDNIIQLAEFLGELPSTKLSKKQSETLARGDYSQQDKEKQSASFDGYRQRKGYSSKTMASAPVSNSKVSTTGSPLPTFQAPTDNSQGYAPTFVNNAVVAPSSRNKSIEDYSTTEKESLLEGWKKELEAMKGGTENSSSGNTQKIASQKALEERIAALEALLLQQKELSDRQYALLNDALKEKERALENKVAELESKEKSREDKRTKEYLADNNEDVAQFRGPASIKAPQGYQSGVNAGEVGGIRSGSGSVSSSQSSAQAMKEMANSEALAREEAKLVKLRQESSGAIVLEGAKNQGANAISLAIPDDFYKQARGNLASINLQQIESKIPKEQIDLLEKNGVIVLILQNGSNPPLEVKVRREKGRLVQLDNSPAVVRKFSLQGLQNSFRN